MPRREELPAQQEAKDCLACLATAMQDYARDQDKARQDSSLTLEAFLGSNYPETVDLSGSEVKSSAVDRLAEVLGSDQLALHPTNIAKRAQELNAKIKSGYGIDTSALGYILIVDNDLKVHTHLSAECLLSLPSSEYKDRRFNWKNQAFTPGKHSEDLDDQRQVS